MWGIGSEGVGRRGPLNVGNREKRGWEEGPVNVGIGRKGVGRRNQ